RRSNLSRRLEYSEVLVPIKCKIFAQSAVKKSKLVIISYKWADYSALKVYTN
ncbi:MAG: hypothetical protein MHPSP_004550, partial [Paramarteilia canceri]